MTCKTGRVPDVAVLVPVFNAAPWIGDAVRSVLAQEGCTFELHLIDDGSTDGTAELAEAAARGHRAFQLTRGGRQGLVASLNLGLATIPLETPFVARFDGDDLMLPGRLAAQVAFLRDHADIALVSSRVEVERAPDAAPAQGMDRYVAWLNALETPEQIARELFVEAPVCHPAVMMRSEVLRGAGGYHDRVWTEDYDLWLRLHEAGHRFHTLPTPFVKWRDHGARVTRNDARCRPDRFFLIKAHYLRRRFGDRLRIWGAGRDGRRLAAALVNEGVTIDAFIDIDPRKIGREKRGGTVPVLGESSLLGPGDGAPIVSAVGIPRARQEIRDALDAKGYVEGLDYVCGA